MTFAKAELSGSTDGRPIAVAATTSPGTTIHTAGAVTGDNNYDELHLDAANIDTVDHVLTLEWGGTSASDQIVFKVPAQSTVTVADGLVLQNALLVKAFADTASKINLAGFANKIRA